MAQQRPCHNPCCPCAGFRQEGHPAAVEPVMRRRASTNSQAPASRERSPTARARNLPHGASRVGQLSAPLSSSQHHRHPLLQSRRRLESTQSAHPRLLPALTASASQIGVDIRPCGGSVRPSTWPSKMNNASLAVARIGVDTVSCKRTTNFQSSAIQGACSASVDILRPVKPDALYVARQH
jgi:hypothetical protein